MSSITDLPIRVTIALGLAATVASAQNRIAQALPGTATGPRAGFYDSDHIAVFDRGVASAMTGGVYLYSYDTIARTATAFANSPIAGPTNGVAFGSCVKPLTTGFAVSDRGYNLTQGRVVTYSSTGAQVRIINGPGANSDPDFGFSFISLGDLNGDNEDELAIGSNALPGSPFFGSVWVWWSNAGAGILRGPLQSPGGVNGLGTKMAATGGVDASGPYSLLTIIDTQHKVNNQTLGAIYRYKVNAAAAPTAGTLVSRHIGSSTQSVSLGWYLVHVGDTNSDGFPEVATWFVNTAANYTYGLHILSMPVVPNVVTNATSLGNLAFGAAGRHELAPYVDVDNDGLQDVLLLKDAPTAGNNLFVVSGKPVNNTLSVIATLTAGPNEFFDTFAVGADINTNAGFPKNGGGLVVQSRPTAGQQIPPVLNGLFIAESGRFGGECTSSGFLPDLVITSGRTVVGTNLATDLVYTNPTGGIGVLELAAFNGATGVFPCGGTYYAGNGLSVILGAVNIPAGGQTASFPVVPIPNLTPSVEGINYTVQAVVLHGTGLDLSPAHYIRAGF